MKERPILFSGDMVRAILDGRKTQTRRPWKEYPAAHHPCPIGETGDRLWVRETWQLCDYDGPGGYPQTDAVYRADGETDDKRKGWRPSIHMPRWASRITLEIVRVSIERVQDITEDGARAEGIQVPRCSCEPCAMGSAICTADAGVYVDAFRDLWQSIYGTWDANPWVWAVEFRRIKP